MTAKKWDDKNRKKTRAKGRANSAIRAGKIDRQPCERCGTDIGIHAHHEDYSKPLEVVWLCTAHHGERHREINEEKRQAALMFD